MTAKQLFNKTMPFIWAKLALGSIMVLVAVVLLAVMMGLGWLFGDWGMVLMFIGWMAAIRAFWLLIMHYFGYMIKAGHIAVIAEACFTGQVPANQVEYGKNAVKERFLTSNVYFAVDKLVSGAVKQIQRGIGKVANFLDFVPGMDKVADLAKFFVELSLGYIDECCLGYTFYQKEQGVFRSACDGVVIYAQNIKHLLKNAAKTMLKVFLTMAITVLLIFIPVGLLFRVLEWSGLIAFLLACLIAWVLKFALLDSFILCQTMAGYMEVAPTTQITFDLYEKLSNLSGKFQELWNKGKEKAVPQDGASESPAKMPDMETRPAVEQAPPAPEPVAEPGARSQFCGQCGSKLADGSRFCGSCGAIQV